MNRQNWDDIRYVLSVAQTGSLNATARELGVTHATVMRRVAAFEMRYGQAVFLKSAAGYSVLPEMQSVLDAARNVEDAVLSVERAIHGSDGAIAGNVRIASTDSISQVLLPPVVAMIAEAYPNLSVTVLSANTYHDLSRLAADIAIRPAGKLEDGLVGEKAAELPFSLYCTDPEPENWIGLNGGLLRSRPAKWMDDNVEECLIRHEADSFLVMSEMAAEGLGKAVLPRFLGDRNSRLKDVGLGSSDMSVPVWVATPEEVSHNARFQAVSRVLLRGLGKVISGYNGDGEAANADR